MGGSGGANREPSEYILPHALLTVHVQLLTVHVHREI